MIKLAIVALALTALATAENAATQGGGGCADKPGFTGGQPQNLGKACAQHTHDNCLYIDEAITNCCGACQTATDAPAGPTTTNATTHGRKPKKGCFHGADMVQTKEYGTISISQLAEKRDAHVLTRNDDGQLEYSSVRYWLHAQPSISMKFFILRTESGHRLSITSKHLIYETDCQGNSGNAVYAKNVQVGRCLYVNDNGQLKETRIVEKGQEQMNGIYSPITTTGSIVVNNVLASCYSYLEYEPLQKLVFQYIIGFQDMMAHWLPTSLYQAAFNNQNGAFVALPKLVYNFLQLSNVFVH